MESSSKNNLLTLKDFNNLKGYVKSKKFNLEIQKDLMKNKEIENRLVSNVVADCAKTFVSILPWNL